MIAPRSNRQASGSTFSRAPDGYGAWYAYMERQGTPVQRWKKPSADFTRSRNDAKTTFLQVNTPALPSRLAQTEREWVQRGNTLIVLGAGNPSATAASFTTLHEGIRIDTGRRQQLTDSSSLTNQPAAIAGTDNPGFFTPEPVLSDRYGAIVWEESIGKGRVIYSITPFLAANAYQDEPGNFAFLEKLVTQNSQSVWVDEYLHGYKEPEVANREDAQDWVSYLLKTPLLPFAVQAIVLLLVLIWASNRRFGQPVPLAEVAKTNSGAYIEALAGVLYHANRSEFVTTVVGREEQRQIQRSLGLGDSFTRLEDIAALKSAWVEQTGRSAEELEQILPQGQHFSKQGLLTWLNRIQEVRSHLPR
nr:DUF4350 domain-containing protein [Myxacorys almedinensis]